MLTAIIVAAGRSRRLGFDKLTAPLDGRPVLAHALEAFENCRSVDAILLVTAAERVDEFSVWKTRYGCTKLAAVVAGGAERHLSVAAGLERLPAACRWVAVHDGARPLVTPAVIDRCMAAAREHRAVACARPLAETVKRTDADGWVAEAVSRERLWVMETPQVFERELLRRAYDYVLAEDLAVTDEVSAIEAIGARVRVVLNDQPNPKITFAADLLLAESLLASRRRPRGHADARADGGTERLPD